jgi:threonine/homoserine/homoserine lactone efflux protein
MTYESLLAFLGYAVVTTITPGPNNIMLLASGLHFGVRRSLPHILGISLGFGAMVATVGFGAGAAFLAIPQLHALLRVAGTTYLLVLAWQIARNEPMTEHAGAVRRPMTLLGAAAFQWVNPKAWVMVIGAISTYLPAPANPGKVAVLALLYMLAGLPCIILWAACGSQLHRYLSAPTHLRIFNWAMALILCASIWPSLMEILADLS